MPTLDFKGKSFVYAHHLSVPFRELVVDAKKSLPAEGEKPSLDDNLIIHGDNLHALKALLPVYAGKVDCIYIDPPYNTGGDWCYDDKINNPLMREWLKTSANPVDKDDLERHDKWLSMMWPRVKLLRELLSPSGIIGMSIDDNEVSNFACLLDDVFGAEKRVALAPWKAEAGGGKAKSGLRVGHEYLLIYHNGDDTAIAKDVVSVGDLNLSDNLGPYQKGRELLKWGAGSLRSDRKDMWFPLPDPDGNEAWPIRNDGKEGRWRLGSQNPLVYQIRKKSDMAHWDMRPFDPGVVVNGKKERWVPYEKIRVSERERVRGTWLDAHGTNADATSELKQIFGTKLFETPKPTALIKWFVSLHANDDAIVLDSFAGSGTTAHAILQLNATDGGNRKFLLVQIPETIPADKPAYALGFREVIDITAERVRRVIRGYKFEGIQREELLRESLTWTKLNNAHELIQRAESFDLLDKHRFDRIAKSVEDGELVVTGEKKVTEKVDGLGGSFTFATLGQEMSLDKLLADGLPTFEALAKYVFFTATGLTLSEVPKPKAALGFIGETDLYRVHLLYQADKKWLQSNDAALTEKLVDEMVAANTGKKKLLIFAAAKFMGQRELSRLGVDFCQLPYAIHRILGD